MKRIVLMMLVVAALIVPLGLSGCVDSTCPPDKVNAALDQMKDIADRISGPATQLQSVESLDELAPIREDFEGLRNEADAIEVPECMVEAKAEMVATYDEYLKAIVALENEDFDGANQAIADADEHLVKFQELMGELANR